jgi:hypothetical protein
MNKKPYEYETCCIDCDDVDALNAMIENAEDSTYQAMLNNCDGLLDWAEEKGYFRHKNGGITLEHDWHVWFFRSTYKDRPCYYLVWSAIEFIWTKGTK